MPSGNEVGVDVWACLSTIAVAAIGAAANMVRGWNSGEVDREPKVGGQPENERYRKVYIESAELADLNALRSVAPRLDRIVQQLEDNHAIMVKVDRVVDDNNAIVKQNNEILLAVHDLRDRFINAEKVQERVRLERLEDRLDERKRREELR